MKGAHRLYLALLLLGLAAPASRGAGVVTAAETEREFVAMCEQVVRSSNPYFGTAQVEQLRHYLAKPLAQPPADPTKRVAAQRQLARELMRIGRPGEAAKLFAETLQLAAGQQLEVRLQLQLLSDLGIAYLRLGEVTNCIGMHGPAMCILPIGEAGRHRDPAAAQEALRAFKGVMAGAPDYPTVKWLANIAAMTAGRYPGELAPNQRVPAARLRSPQDIGRFPDVAHKAGLTITANAGGALVEDFDGDHLLDVVTSSQNPCAPLRFFRNTGRGNFENRSREAGLESQLGGLNLVHADYDNDGHPDILVLRGGWFGEEGRMRNSLLKNGGDGTFSDHTFAAGLARPAYPTQTAAWADYDLDGDLDLYIGNEAHADNLADPGALENIRDAYPSQLFRNNGAGADGIVTFTDVARRAGVENLRFTKGVAWGDYDNDGDPDLYVSNLGPNRLYRNNRDGSFTDVARELGVREPVDLSFASWWFDYDNDGDRDLFVADYNASTLVIATYYLGEEVAVGAPRLYRNDSGRGFTEVGRELGLTAPALPMGANFGDLDNDGFLDFYLGTGLPPYEALMPNLMYRNDGGKRFVDVTFSGGFGHLQKGHGVAFADLDNDGDQDIFEEMGGAVPGDVYPSVLYENPGHGNAWIALKLVGVQSNRSALGARLELELDTPAGRRRIHRTITSGGSFGGSPLRQEIGLGRVDGDRTIRRLEIFWPRSGITQVFEDVAVRRFYEVREGESRLRPLDLAAFRLGG